MYIGLSINSKSISGNSFALLQFNLNSDESVDIKTCESIISSMFIISLPSFLTISYIYLPDITISPNVSIFSISFLGIKDLIANSLSVLNKYKPSLFSSNFIQFNIGIKFLLDIPLIT